MSALGIRAINYQTNAPRSLKVRLHASGVILKHEGSHTRVSKHLLGHCGIHFIVEHLDDNYFFRHVFAPRLPSLISPVRRINNIFYPPNGFPSHFPFSPVLVIFRFALTTLCLAGRGVSIDVRPVLVLIAAYLLGSIPFGYLVVRARTGSDVRETGSGGTGATNVSRRAGKIAGFLTLILDALKGALAVVLARMLLAEGFGINWWVAGAVVLAIAGHCFPVWLGFRGGKGVATGVGAFLALSPLAVACASLLFLLIVWATRYVSLGSITAAAALPLSIWILDRHLTSEAALTPLLTAAMVGAAIIIFMHRANIGRLLSGTERKFK